MKLEYVKRLKELGVWKPEHPCLYAASYGCKPVEECNGYDGCEFPTLSQLLEEIEERGWFWDMWHDCTGCGIDVWTHEIEKAKWNTTADTCEDAVALALIEILEGEK